MPHDQQDASNSIVATTQLLRQKGMRPTRQRVQIGCLLFDGSNKHVSPDQVAQLIEAQNIHMSLGTIYNTLRQFAESGLLREVNGLGDKLIYDTNLSSHHHFMDVETGALIDINSSEIGVDNLPDLPDGFALDGVDVMIKIRKSK